MTTGVMFGNDYHCFLLLFGAGFQDFGAMSRVDPDRCYITFGFYVVAVDVGDVLMTLGEHVWDQVYSLL